MTTAMAVARRASRRRLLGAALAIFALAGCASDRGDYLQIGLLTQSLRQSLGGSATQVEPSRALVDESEVPLIKAEIPSRGSLAVIYPVGQNGPVTTWTATDRTTLALRGGQIVGSRGLAPDLMSARVPTLDALRRGGPVERSHFYLGRDDQTVRRDYTCTGQQGPAETLEIIGVRFATTVITETCTGPTDRFVNRYWVQADGTVRQSVQWAGPDVGFLKLQRLDR